MWIFDFFNMMLSSLLGDSDTPGGEGAGISNDG